MAVEYVSVDGVIQAPGHDGEDPEGGFQHGGWTDAYMHEHARYLTDLFRGAGAFLLGRITYEIFAAYWPTVTDAGDAIAKALNSRPKYVASTTMNAAAWAGTTVIHGDIARKVAELKQQPAGPVLAIGSSRLVQTLGARGLVDEYQLWVHPVVLGSGKRLFLDGDPRIDLRLVDTRTSGGGLVILSYVPTGR
ncbi:MAG TPA: dihydrofolate reductase family protein [Actinomycetes bacterium]|nr:dihydrofolate reductase family protein [Actinomycetes bacterium]